MAIKTRLILAMTAILCVATIIIGSVAIGAVVQSMTERIDERLSEFMRLVTTALADADDVESTPTEPLNYQQIAVLAVDADGSVVEALPAGSGENPLNLPQIPDPLPKPGTSVTVSSEDGTIEYRLQASAQQPGLNGLSDSDEDSVRLVAAIALDEVEAVQSNLMSIMVITVTMVLGVSVLATWFITRRGLRPVNQMIDSAAAVADGDLDARLPTRSERTEIGRLATALNIMVSKLVSAITQRDAEQARLRRFVADASHELRTPLSAISGYADLYESGGTPPGPALDRAMNRISGESHRMSALLDDLLTLARLDRESQLDRRLLDLRSLAVDAVDDATAADRERELSMDSGDRPVPIMADEPRIRQVIANLLANTRVHTPPGTKVNVAVFTRRSEATLTVSDNGPGIPTSHRHRVFDRFYRADASRSRDTGGTGLGLSIVKSIVEQHDGRVELESQLGRGTTIRVVLPSPRTDH